LSLVRLTPEQKQRIAALRTESPLLAQLNLRIIAAGGQPIPVQRTRDHLKEIRSSSHESWSH
jgi:hypothetical protein